MRLLTLLLSLVMVSNVCQASIIRINPDDTYQVAPDGNCQKKKPKVNINKHHNKQKKTLKRSK